MPPKDWTIHVEDMLDAIRQINIYVADITYEEFAASRLIFDAVVRNVSVLGEAARRMPPEIQEQFPDVPWSEMRTMRNFVVHQYDEVNPQTIWDTIHQDFPSLVDQLHTILANE